MPPVTAPFAQVLAARRAELNARFAVARQRLPALDPTAFGEFLHDTVDPMVRAVDAVAPASVEPVALAAYDVALDLVGQQLVDGDVRGTAIRESWRRVLPAVYRVLAIDPPRVIAALTNAAHHVAATAGARPDRWIADLARLGADCDTPEALLRLGQVVAWRAGLAHYRRGAIGVAGKLAEPLALAAVGAANGAQWAAVARGFAESEWFDPAQPNGGGGARVVASVGSFRGFGGLFAEPPRVAIVDQQLYVASGDERWLLTADLFGATFHRATFDVAAPTTADVPRAGAPPTSVLPAGVRLTVDGVLTAPDGPIALPNAGRVTSHAATATTLAVTWSHSHQVTLVALA